jgi:hypothetical protein
MPVCPPMMFLLSNHPKQFSLESSLHPPVSTLIATEFATAGILLRRGDSVGHNINITWLVFLNRCFHGLIRSVCFASFLLAFP